MSVFAVEVALLWSAVALYIASTALLAGTIIFRRPARPGLGTLAAAVGLAPHGAAVVLRWVATGHGPYILRHEVLSANALIAVAAMLLAVRRRPGWAALGLVVMPVAILAIGLGLSTTPQLRELPPSLRSTWLVFHVTFAKLAAGAFLLSVSSATLSVLKSRAAPAGWLDRVPSLDALDAFVVRLVGFGFLFWTIAVAAGAIWANQSWGRYWGWDAIETWSLVTWIVYGTFLHAKLFFRLRPAPTAWAAIGCFVVFVLTLLVLPALLPSIHSAYFQ